MRIDKFKWKDQDDLRICSNCGLLLPESQGIMKHLEKCWAKEYKR